MATREGARIGEQMGQKVQAMKQLCMGIDEKTASARPGERWSPKEIISHLCGREGVGMLPAVRAYIEQEMPEIDVHPADPSFSEARSRMTLSQLVEVFEKEYARLAELAATLTGEQLGRKAHVPAFKQAPCGEYPTLREFLGILGEHHLEYHINHMKEVLQALGISRAG